MFTPRIHDVISKPCKLYKHIGKYPHSKIGAKDVELQKPVHYTIP